ncbi:hypothetical protein AcW1_005699 [Taiwanofungus camphoratus]|nr:hypothetical protein AcW2_004462 [Antrodia cinnamomea]KAI0957242.1 hypothetical protein AcW1_005699 [Antrodia cinnamomea]
MLGVEGYGSDNGSDTEAQFTPSISSTASLTTKLAPSPKKSTFSLPPPTNAPAAPSSASTPFSGLSLPAPKTRRAPKKITIGLPELPPETSKGDDVDARRVAKKPRLESLESKARSSALLSMLPAPKNTAPVTITQERVLGGGRGPGLVFNTTASRSSRTSTVEDVEDAKEEGDATEHAETANPVKNVPIPFLPPSLVKGKANISVEETNDRPQTLVHAPSSAPAVDFFSIVFLNMQQFLRRHLCQHLLYHRLHPLLFRESPPLLKLMISYLPNQLHRTNTLAITYYRRAPGRPTTLNITVLSMTSGNGNTMLMYVLWRKGRRKVSRTWRRRVHKKWMHCGRWRRQRRRFRREKRRRR